MTALDNSLDRLYTLNRKVKTMTKKTITIKRTKANGSEKIVTLKRAVYLHVDILEAYFHKALAINTVLDFDSLCDSVIAKG